MRPRGRVPLVRAARHLSSFSSRRLQDGSPGSDNVLFDDEGADSTCEELVAVSDAASGLRAFIAIHRTRDGCAAGGIRRWAYPSDTDAVADVQRLARMMTLKLALADAPAGGAKTVVLDRPGLDLKAVYRALGRAVESLDGRYLTGPDVGTGEAELASVRETTRWANPPQNDAGASTAAGVLAGLRGLLRTLDDGPSFAGRTFVVQGLGSVGWSVATTLHREGATVHVTDLRTDLLDRARAAGLRPVAPERALLTRCDVFVPCAMGGILTEAAAHHLPARGICGSANNQLATRAAGDTLHDRGVLYAPDFAVNSGAAVEGVYTTRQGDTPATRAAIRQRLDRIEPLVESILRESIAKDLAPHDIALRMARERM